MTTAGKGGEQN